MKEKVACCVEKKESGSLEIISSSLRGVGIFLEFFNRLAAALFSVGIVIGVAIFLSYTDSTGIDNALAIVAASSSIFLVLALWALAFSLTLSWFFIGAPAVVRMTLRIPSRGGQQNTKNHIFWHHFLIFVVFPVVLLAFSLLDLDLLWFFVALIFHVVIVAIFLHCRYRPERGFASSLFLCFITAAVVPVLVLFAEMALIKLAEELFFDEGKALAGLVFLLVLYSLFAANISYQEKNRLAFAPMIVFILVITVLFFHGNYPERAMSFVGVGGFRQSIVVDERGGNLFRDNSEFQLRRLSDNTFQLDHAWVRLSGADVILISPSKENKEVVHLSKSTVIAMIPSPTKGDSKKEET